MQIGRTHPTPGAPGMGYVLLDAKEWNFMLDLCCKLDLFACFLSKGLKLSGVSWSAAWLTAVSQTLAVATAVAKEPSQRMMSPGPLLLSLWFSDPVALGMALALPHRNGNSHSFSPFCHSDPGSYQSASYCWCVFSSFCSSVWTIAWLLREAPVQSQVLGGGLLPTI